MKLVIQRVIQSNLTIDKKTYSSIGYGMVIFIGLSEDDNECFLNKTASKVFNSTSPAGAVKEAVKGWVKGKLKLFFHLHHSRTTLFYSLL